MENSTCDLSPDGTTATLQEAHPTYRHHLADSVIDQFIVPILCSVGILGNCLNIAIIVMLAKYKVNRSTESQEKTIYAGLISLAVADILCCVCLLPRATVSERKATFQEYSFVLYYQAYSMGVISTWMLVSTWLIVVLAATRYFGICHPFKARTLLYPHVIYVMLGIVWGVCILVNLPTFWMFKIMRSQGTIYIDLGVFSHYTSIGKAYQWARAIIGVFIPAILLTYFNIRLVMELRRSFILQRNCAISDSIARALATRNKLTFTLIMVILLFIVLVLPCELMDILTHLLNIVSPDKQAFILTRRIANVLQIFNFCINFVLYCALNDQFRKVMKQLFCQPKKLGHPSIAQCGSKEGGDILLETQNADRKTLPDNVTVAERFAHDLEINVLV